MVNPDWHTHTPFKGMNVEEGSQAKHLLEEKAMLGSTYTHRAMFVHPPVTFRLPLHVSQVTELLQVMH